MSIRNLTRRVQRLNKTGKFKHLWDNVKEFNFSLYTLPISDGTEIPPGARIVRDFFVQQQSEDWGRKGILFSGGHHQERLAIDDEDHGRVRFDAPPERQPPPMSEFEPKLQSEGREGEVRFVVAYPLPDEESDL
jgi:hypothetical protein